MSEDLRVVSNSPSAAATEHSSAGDIAAAHRLLREAIGLVHQAEGNRLRLYLRAGRIAQEAKASVGHGNWLAFVWEHYALHEHTIRRMMNVHEAIELDPWLRARIEENPEAWSVRRALEYAAMAAATRREAQEKGLYVDFRGTRVPIEEAPTSAFRHHKRVLSGTAKAPKSIVSPLGLARLGKRHLMLGEAAAELRGLEKRIEEIRAKLPFGSEDFADDGPRTTLALAAYGVQEKAESLHAAITAEGIEMKAKLGRL